MIPEFVQAFVRQLSDLLPSIRTTVDSPAVPEGETFIDIVDGEFATEVSYRPMFGFGIYVTPVTYGQRPDELFRSAQKAAQRSCNSGISFRKMA